MKKGFILSAVAAMMLAGATTSLVAEPGNFGVNGSDAWNQPLQKRVKHTDSFGNTYYTMNHAAPKTCVRKEIKKESAGYKQAPKEIVRGLTLTLAAIDAIEKKKSDEAIKKLQEADRLFTQALKADPGLDMVPVEQEIVVKQFTGTINDIKADIATARKLLKNYDTQLARDILLPLEDEIDIVTHYIPMKLYPQVTRKALELLKAGKTEAALNELAAGLNIIVADEVVVPIPLLTARELVDAASKLGADRKKEALAHLKAAKKELHKALLLGYTSRHSKEYKALYDRITQIEKEIRKNGSAPKLFEHLKKGFESLLHKTRNEKVNLSDRDSVWKGTAKAHAAAAREETEDKLRFEEKMEADDF